MYDHILEEMADAIAFELNVPSNNLLGVLNSYWQDKIAHVWCCFSSQKVSWFTY